MANETKVVSMNEQGHEIVERGSPQTMTVAALLRGAKVDSMNAVCSRALSADKIVKLFALAASRTPKLMQCTPISVANAMMQCAELGIAPGTLGTAYLIPFENRKAGTVECQLIVGYRGLVELARRSGQVATITADIVREGDEFEYENGVEPKLRHRPKAATAAKRTHAWAAVKFKDGSYQFAVLRWEEVEAIRGRSRAGQSGPWVTDTDEMAKKTALRRLCKLLPLTLEIAAQMEKADRTEFDFEDMAAATEQAEQTAHGVEAMKARLAAAQPNTPPHAAPAEAGPTQTGLTATTVPVAEGASQTPAASSSTRGAPGTGASGTAGAKRGKSIGDADAVPPPVEGMTSGPPWMD